MSGTKVDDYGTGHDVPVSSERWAYAVWGAIIALVSLDVGRRSIPSAFVLGRLCELVRDQADAEVAIEAARKAGPGGALGRTDAALIALAECRKAGTGLARSARDTDRAPPPDGCK